MDYVETGTKMVNYFYYDIKKMGNMKDYKKYGMKMAN